MTQTLDGPTTASYIRILRRLIKNSDERTRLRAQVLGDQVLGDIVSQYDGDNTPERNEDAPSLCFGNDYAPLHRTIQNEQGRIVPNENYQSEHDICGYSCPYGLYKDSLQEGEVQGNQGCYLLLLFTQVFDIPLAPPDLGELDANKYRVELMEAIPGIMNRAEQSASILDPVSNETDMQTYVLQPGIDVIHEGYVYDSTTRQPRQFPDGTYVLENHVVEAPPVMPASPPALPEGTGGFPAVPATPSAPQPPQPPTPPVPQPQPPTSPVAPSAPQPPMPPTPPKPPATPATTAPTPPAAPTALPQPPAPPAPPKTPPAPPKIAAPSSTLPPTPPTTVDVGVDHAVIDQIEEDVQTMLSGYFNSIRASLTGRGEKASVGKNGRVATMPQPTSGNEPTDDDTSDEIDPDVPITDQFDADLSVKFEGYTRTEFSDTFLQGTDDSDLEYMCAALDIDTSKYAAKTRIRSMKAALLQKVYGKSGKESIL